MRADKTMIQKFPTCVSDALIRIPDFLLNSGQNRNFLRARVVSLTAWPKGFLTRPFNHLAKIQLTGRDTDDALRSASLRPVPDCFDYSARRQNKDFRRFDRCDAEKICEVLVQDFDLQAEDHELQRRWNQERIYLV